MAPKGAYFRKIGHISSSPLYRESYTLEVNNHHYIYDRGIFWVKTGNQFIVVKAPVGAIVSDLPAGSEMIDGSTDSIYYYFGTFFKEINGKYEVISPADGTVVSYIPEGHIRYEVEGKASASIPPKVYYFYHGSCFMPSININTLMYKNFECPQGTISVPKEIIDIKDVFPTTIQVSVDNEFILYLNGKEMIRSNYPESPGRIDVPLQDGDVIAIEAIDWEDGASCGFTLVGRKSSKVLFSSEDFYYDLDPTPGWKISSSLMGFILSDPDNPSITPRSSKAIRRYWKVKPVWSIEKVGTVFFKMVYEAPDS